MNKKINYGRNVNFTGRNGYFKQSGVCIYYPEIIKPTADYRGEVILTPVTSKGKEGNCSIEIPFENVVDVVAHLSALCSVPVRPKKKFLLIVIEERNGEQEYTFRVLREVGLRANGDKVAEQIARTWYDEGKKGRKQEDGGYYFWGGSLHAKVERVEEISESDYLTLSKYI